MASHRSGRWSQAEDVSLMKGIQDFEPQDWGRIAQAVGSRTPEQCRERYHRNLKPTLNHDPITPEEDLQIECLVDELGKKWAEIASRLHGRTGNAVKNWWQNRKKRMDGPGSNRITDEEGLEIERLVGELGKRWVEIASRLDGRTASGVRAWWHRSQNRKKRMDGSSYDWRPTLSRGDITHEEGLEIERLVGELGKRWVEIASRFDGRTDNAVRKWWKRSQNCKTRMDGQQRPSPNNAPGYDLIGDCYRVPGVPIGPIGCSPSPVDRRNQLAFAGASLTYLCESETPECQATSSHYTTLHTGEGSASRIEARVIIGSPILTTSNLSCPQSTSVLNSSLLSSTSPHRSPAAQSMTKDVHCEVATLERRICRLCGSNDIGDDDMDMWCHLKTHNMNTRSQYCEGVIEYERHHCGVWVNDGVTAALPSRCEQSFATIMELQTHQTLTHPAMPNLLAGRKPNQDEFTISEHDWSMYNCCSRSLLQHKLVILHSEDMYEDEEFSNHWTALLNLGAVFSISDSGSLGDPEVLALAERTNGLRVESHEQYNGSGDAKNLAGEPVKLVLSLDTCTSMPEVNPSCPTLGGGVHTHIVSAPQTRINDVLSCLRLHVARDSATDAIDQLRQVMLDWEIDAVKRIMNSVIEIIIAKDGEYAELEDTYDMLEGYAVHECLPRAPIIRLFQELRHLNSTGSTMTYLAYIISPSKRMMEGIDPCMNLGERNRSFDGLDNRVLLELQLAKRRLQKQLSSYVLHKGSQILQFSQYNSPSSLVLYDKILRSFRNLSVLAIVYGYVTHSTRIE